jgi:outer membrane protein OmpA-like peptidoglycan-associated protein
MKKTLKAISQYTLIAAFGTMVLTSCKSDPDSPGSEYMPDMYRSPSIEPFVDYGQVRNKENTNGASYKLSARIPVEGTVPYFGIDFKNNMPFAYYPALEAKETHGLEMVHTEANGYERSKEASNPVMLHAGNEKAILKEAKHLYENNCIHCHGEKGDGKGSIVKSGAYSGVPNYNTLMDLSDGQIMYSISYGKGNMGAHLTQLSVEERWKLVHYVNALQNGGKADLDMNIGLDFNDSIAPSTESKTLEDIYFNTGKASFNKRRVNTSLFTLLNFMSNEQNQNAKIEVIGYTDNSGDADQNIVLSQKRAEAVKDFLIEYGVNSGRVSTKGLGSSNPRADNSTVEGQSKNRRTEVRILK